MWNNINIAKFRLPYRSTNTCLQLNANFWHEKYESWFFIFGIFSSFSKEKLRCGICLKRKNFLKGQCCFSHSPDLVSYISLISVVDIWWEKQSGASNLYKLAQWPPSRFDLRVIFVSNNTIVIPNLHSIRPTSETESPMSESSLFSNHIMKQFRKSSYSHSLAK